MVRTYTKPSDNDAAPNIDISRFSFTKSWKTIPKALTEAFDEYRTIDLTSFEDDMLSNHFDFNKFANEKVDKYIISLKQYLQSKGVNKSDSVFKDFKAKEIKKIITELNCLFEDNQNNNDGGVEVQDVEVELKTNPIEKFVELNSKEDMKAVTPVDISNSEDHFTIDPHKLTPLDDNVNDELALSKMIIKKEKPTNNNGNPVNKLGKVIKPKVVSLKELLDCSYLTITILNFSGLAGVSIEFYDTDGNLIWVRTMPQTFVSVPKGSGLLFANIFSTDVNREVSDDTDDDNFYLQRYSSTSCICHFLTSDDVQALFAYVFGDICGLQHLIYEPKNVEQLISRLTTSVIVYNTLLPYDMPIDYAINNCQFSRGERMYKRCFSYLSISNSPIPVSNSLFDDIANNIFDKDNNVIAKFKDDEICYLKDSDYPVGPGLIAIMGVGGSGKSVLANSQFITVGGNPKPIDVIALGEPGKVFNVMNIQNLSTILNEAISSKSAVVVDSLRLMMLTGQLGVGKGGISKEITNLLTYIDTIAYQTGVPFIVITNPMEDSSEVVNILFHALKSVASTTIMTKQVSKYINNSLQIDVKISTRLGFMSDYKYDRSPRDMTVLVNNELIEQVKEEIPSDERFTF